MTKTKQMKHILNLLALSVVSAVGFTASAADAPPPPGVLETFTCSYNPGKDASDVLAARDYYVKQADKAGIELGPSYMWSLLKGDVGFDLVWLTPHENRKAFATAADAEAAASELSGVGARFAAAATCRAGLGVLTPVFQRDVPDRGDSPGIIYSSACTLKHGVGAAQIGDLTAHIAGVLGDMGDNTPSATYAITPTMGGDNAPDWVLFSVFDNLTSWATFIDTIVGSTAGQRVGRHLDQVLDCGRALWSSERVIAPGG